MEKYRTIEELEKIVNETKITLGLDFVIRTMKVLELAESFMEETEQGDLVNDYANTLFHEINEFIEEQELVMLEDDNQFEL